MHARQEISGSRPSERQGGSSRGQVTRLLGEMRDGDEAAADQLLPLVYAELRALADDYLGRERPGHTLQATALVHEAYLRLLGSEGIEWQDRGHFVAVAARAMRQVLVGHAIRRGSQKRGGKKKRLPMDDEVALFEERSTDLVALDEALTALSAVDAQQGRIVELRFFGGLTVAETARLLSLSTRTVEREWSMARAWLRRAVGGND